jgi:hypothetical protein
MLCRFLLIFCAFFFSSLQNHWVLAVMLGFVYVFLMLYTYCSCVQMNAVNVVVVKLVKWGQLKSTHTYPCMCSWASFNFAFILGAGTTTEDGLKHCSSKKIQTCGVPFSLEKSLLCYWFKQVWEGRWHRQVKQSQAQLAGSF